LAQCIADATAKGKCGLTTFSSAKKMSFLSDPKYLKYKGFQVADTTIPYFFVLLYLPFEKKPIPKFRACAEQGKISEKGMVLYYSNQCPHLFAEIAERHGKTVTLFE
jgi:hypothetical protein